MALGPREAEEEREEPSHSPAGDWLAKECANDGHLQHDLLPSCRTPVPQVEANPETLTVTGPHAEPADERFCLRQLTPTRYFHLRRVGHLFQNTDSHKGCNSTVPGTSNDIS